MSLEVIDHNIHLSKPITYSTFYKWNIKLHTFTQLILYYYYRRITTCPQIYEMRHGSGVVQTTLRDRYKGWLFWGWILVLRKISCGECVDIRCALIANGLFGISWTQRWRVDLYTFSLLAREHIIMEYIAAVTRWEIDNKYLLRRYIKPRAETVVIQRHKQLYNWKCTKN